MNPEKIYWRDIGSLSDNGWAEKKYLVEEARKAYERECITIGFVLHEEEDFLVIAATILPPCKEGAEADYHDASMIMKSVIIKREKL